jgi:(S)-2-hydroxyglutarate dehydrogenase
MAAYARRRGLRLMSAASSGRVDESELSALAELQRRRWPMVRRLDAAGTREYEPQVHCIAAFRVDSTGVIDYAAVCGPGTDPHRELRAFNIRRSPEE